MFRLAILLVLMALTAVLGGPLKLYQKTDDDTYQRVLVPVSSTVIPIPPDYTVGIGLQVGGGKTPPEGVTKPEGDIKLLTVKKNKKIIEKKVVKKTSAVAEEIEN
ncbi:UNVERIFIED_CONTAM: hypothetical protein RMT77_002008 [Armadillidium vulgare]